MPSDWTDLEVDLRIDDESRYIDTAVSLSQVNAQPYSEADWHWRLLVAHSFGHAAAAETVRACSPSSTRRRRRRDAAARGARGSRRGRPDVGPAGERARGVPPAPLAVVARRGSRRRPRPDALQPGRGDAGRAPATRSWSARPPTARLDEVELSSATSTPSTRTRSPASALPCSASTRTSTSRRGGRRRRRASTSSCRARGWRASCRELVAAAARRPSP